MRTLRFAIERLTDCHPSLFLESHTVACVALMSSHSVSPCSFEVECENIRSTWLGRARRFGFNVSWSPQTEAKAERLRSTVQVNTLVEMAAVAVALALAHSILDPGQLDVTAMGARADYRSLEAGVVLEVSGTREPSELKRRQRAKVAQALANTFGWNAYVVVCLFAPQASRVHFSYHQTTTGSIHG